MYFQSLVNVSTGYYWWVFGKQRLFLALLAVPALCKLVHTVVVPVAERTAVKVAVPPAKCSYHCHAYSYAHNY